MRTTLHLSANTLFLVSLIANCIFITVTVTDYCIVASMNDFCPNITETRSLIKDTVYRKENKVEDSQACICFKNLACLWLMMCRKKAKRWVVPVMGYESLAALDTVWQSKTISFKINEKVFETCFFQLPLWLSDMDYTIGLLAWMDLRWQNTMDLMWQAAQQWTTVEATVSYGFNPSFFNVW